MSGDEKGHGERDEGASSSVETEGACVLKNFDETVYLQSDSSLCWPIERHLPFDLQKASLNGVALYFDSLCASAKEYSFLSLSLFLLLCFLFLWH